VSAGGFFSLIYADYQAFYRFRAESRWRLALLAPLRMLVNPSMHAVILIRIWIASPRPTAFIWRNILIAKHSIDVFGKPSIGPGLMLSHPFGIVLDNVTIGKDVLMTHNVTIGAIRGARPGEEHNPELPIVGDRVVIYPNTVIAGGVRIGADSVIGANSLVDHDVPPGSVFSRGEIRTRAASED
jgi:serine O-acetyltransferase